MAIAAGGLVGGWAIWYYSQPSTTTLMLQTTTSMNDSGLLDLIKPAFLTATGINLEWISAGTGQALQNAADGNGDVVIVHSASAEKDFINHSTPGPAAAYSGYGIMRVSFAYNFFIVVGPVADPAGVLSATNGSTAFQKIYTAGEGALATFVSRGDGSGTQSKENSTWDAAGKGLGYSHTSVQTKTWFKSTGQGMGATLTYANETDGYCLTDYGTWLSLRDSLGGLTNLTGFFTDFRNIYSIIAVDPAKYADVKFEAAKQLIYFMLTEGQNIIGNYTIDGESLFTKNITVAGICFCGSPLCEVENGELCSHLWAPKPPGCASMAMADNWQVGRSSKKKFPVPS